MAHHSLLRTIATTTVALGLLPALAAPMKAAVAGSPSNNVAAALALPYTVVVTEMGMNNYTKMQPLTKVPTMNMGGMAGTVSGIRVLGQSKLLPTGAMAHGIGVLPGTQDVFVSDFMGTTYKEIDLKTMRIVHTFKVGLSPTHIVFTPDHRLAFVSNYGSNDESVLNLRTGSVRTISFPGQGCFHPHGLTLSADAKTLYVACAGGAWIYTINVTTLKAGHSVITGPGAYDVALDQPRHELWVPNQTGDSISVLDSRTLKSLATIKVKKGSAPALMVISPDGARAYVANLLGNSLSVIDTASRKVLKTIPVAAQPFGPAITPDGKYVYVPGIQGNAVTVIRTSDLSVVANVPAPVGPVQIAILPR